MKIIIILILTLLSAQPNYVVVTNNNPSPGKIFVHSMGAYMSIIDTDLDLYWTINNNNKGMDFKLNNSKLSYFHKPFYGLNESFWIIADETMTEIDTVMCTEGYTDYHDFIITDDNTYITQAYSTEVFDLSHIGLSQFELVSGVLIIQEFDFDDNLIFNWNALDHLDIYDYDLLQSFQMPGSIEWMHGNSIDIDFDNNLIISNRRSSEIIKIDRDSGEIIWIWGGPSNEFEIINDPLNGVKYQHDVTRLENGNFLIFDNRYNHVEISRVVEYSVDEINKTATLVWDYENPYGYHARAMGSAQRLPNQNTFINWGSLQIEGQLVGASLMEVDYEKNIRLELKFIDYQTYKATKSDFEFSIPMGFGDTNLDESLNIQDIIYAVNYVLYHDRDHSIFDLYKIDSNFDYLINVIDIIEIVNRVLAD